METNSILSANILDILFDGRNKEYGAYDLRRTYNLRITSAIGVTALVVMIFVTLILVTHTAETKAFGSTTFETAPVKPYTEVKDKPEKKIIKPVKAKSLQVTPPVILEDNKVKEPPVENSKFIDARIDTKIIDGTSENTIPIPSDVTESHVKNEPFLKKEIDDMIIDKVEIEAKFNGNWNAYVKKEIEEDIDELVEAGESGTCIVRFVVSKDGSVSNVEAITMKGTKLAEIAVNAIRKGLKWIPAQQNGRVVNAYRQQPVTFKIAD